MTKMNELDTFLFDQSKVVDPFIIFGIWRLLFFLFVNLCLLRIVIANDITDSLIVIPAEVNESREDSHERIESKTEEVVNLQVSNTVLLKFFLIDDDGGFLKLELKEYY